jgi:hypothetical protein
LRVSVSSVDVGFRFIFSATWLLDATKAQPLERFPWLGQHPPLVSILIFWFLFRVVDEALSIDGQGEFRAIAVLSTAKHCMLLRLLGEENRANKIPLPAPS